MSKTLLSGVRPKCEGRSQFEAFAVLQCISHSAVLWDRPEFSSGSYASGRRPSQEERRQAPQLPRWRRSQPLRSPDAVLGILLPETPSVRRLDQYRIAISFHITQQDNGISTLQNSASCRFQHRGSPIPGAAQDMMQLKAKGRLNNEPKCVAFGQPEPIDLCPAGHGIQWSRLHCAIAIDLTPCDLRATIPRPLTRPIGWRSPAPCFRGIPATTLILAI
jgi:hypothetical protein